MAHINKMFYSYNFFGQNLSLLIAKFVNNIDSAEKLSMPASDMPEGP